MNTKKIQKIKDNAFISWYNIYRTELMLKDLVFFPTTTGKSYTDLLTEEFLAANDDEPVQLEDFLQKTGVICAVEDAKKSEVREGYYQALASDMVDKYMLWWKASDIESGILGQFEVEMIYGY